MTDQREEKLVIKDKKYVLHYDLVDTDDVNSNWLKVEGCHWFDYDVYNISYLVRSREELDASNFSLLLHFRYSVERFSEITNGKKCLIIARTESNNDFLYEYNRVLSDIITKIKEQSVSLIVSFDKSILTINFYTEDDIPLNKMLKFNLFIILIARVFKMNGKFYQRVFLNECYYTVKNNKSSDKEM